MRRYGVEILNTRPGMGSPTSGLHGRLGMVKREFPFSPYPVGWFQVAYCDEIEVGEAKPLKYFGQDLVAFRGEDG